SRVWFGVFLCAFAYVLFLLLYLVLRFLAGVIFDSIDMPVWDTLILPARNWARLGFLLAALLRARRMARAAISEATSDAGKKRANGFFQGLWLGYCFAVVYGYLMGGFVGIVTITFPAVLLFWLLMHRLSRFLLPLDEGDSLNQAFRALVTFSAGTNYPYYVMQGRDKVLRVAGNQFAQDMVYGPTIFGPGIFLTGPDHVVAVSDGLAFIGVKGPGVAFTDLFHLYQEPLDLRPQQRAYTVDAQTQDGIQLKFVTFGPFQLDPGEQKPTLGNSFPFRPSSIFKAFHGRPINVHRYKDEDGDVIEERQQRRWDELYSIKGTHVMQDIIAEYRFDQLYEPEHADKDPRIEIARKYREQLSVELESYGIKVLGGGISNLLPAQKDLVIKQRIKSWQASQERRILEQLGDADAKVEAIVNQARVNVQEEMIIRIGAAIAGKALDKDVLYNTMALRFVESLSQMLDNPNLGEQVPPQELQTARRAMRVLGDRGS
ncbi:MAG: hypothetical protein JXD18_15550, partial [Anaerolineae bacterium]|nr:hypothetical protein [Anaerolineae bacterium]